MSRPILDEYRLHQILFTKWRQKLSPNEAIKDIRSKFGEVNLSVSKVRHYFKRFDMGNTELLDSDFYISTNAPFGLHFGQQREDMPSLDNSLKNILFSIDECDGSTRGMLATNNSRFLILPKQLEHNNVSFVVCDLFLGTKRDNPMPRDLFRSNCLIIDNFLFAINSLRNAFKLHVFKINYNKLTIEILNTIDIGVKLKYLEILSDQSNSKRVIIYDSKTLVIGQIYGDAKIVMDQDKKIDPHFNTHGTRFLGNKLQGFDYKTTGNNVNLMKFCELNLDTMEKSELNECDLFAENKIKIERGWTYSYCWVEEKFYGFYRVETSAYEKLLTFNLDTFKWSEMQIMAKGPETMFVDQNGMMTFQVGEYKTLSVFYRVGLGKSDKLTNLTWLFALRQSSYYRKDKYIKVARKIQI